jgi:hypothetical protein
MSVEESKNGAYWERNMLALLLATFSNYIVLNGELRKHSGWYKHPEFEGWSRVISLYDGTMTFHVPDDFDLGDLQEIEPNWDGHSTVEKWEKIMKMCGVTSVGG